MGIIDKALSYMGLAEDEAEQVETKEVEGKKTGESNQSASQNPKSGVPAKQAQQPAPTVVDFPKKQKKVEEKMKIVLIQPVSFEEESAEIADNLIEGRVVILNIQSMKHDEATRMIDFLSGVLYREGGDIQRANKKSNIFICTPENVGIQRIIPDEMIMDAIEQEEE